jgi:hypothetical protein
MVLNELRMGHCHHVGRSPYIETMASHTHGHRSRTEDEEKEETDREEKMDYRTSAWGEITILNAKLLFMYTE